MAAKPLPRSPNESEPTASLKPLAGSHLTTGAALGFLPARLCPLQSAFILGLIGLLIAVSFASSPRIWLLVWACIGLMLNLGSQRASDSTGSVPSQERGLEGKQA